MKFKKIFSSIIAASLIASLAVMPTVYADYYGYMQSFTGATINGDTNYPTGWANLSGSTRTGEFVTGLYGKAADDSAFKITSTATNGQWATPPVFPNRVLANIKNDSNGYNESETLISGSYYHLTAEVAACDADFYNIGLYAHRVRVSGTEGNSGDITTFNGPILGFTQSTAGTVTLTAWGEDITPTGFEFKTKTWYTLDVIFNGISNTMDTYLNGEFVKTVSLTTAHIPGASSYTNWHLYYLKYIGLVYDRRYGTATGSAALFDNVGFGNYYYKSITKPAISAPVSDTIAYGSAVPNNTLVMQSGATVADVKAITESTNSIVFIDANGALLGDAHTLSSTDRMVEIIPITCSATDTSRTYTDNERVFKYYNIQIETAGTPVGNKLTFSDYSPSPATNADDGVGSVDLPKMANEIYEFNKWSFTCFYLYAPTGVFGKSASDKCLRIRNVNANTWVAEKNDGSAFDRTGNFLWAYYDIAVSSTQNVHISAEMAADNTSFKELGLWNRFTDNASIGDPFCFAKNGDNIDIKSFGDVIVSNFDFKTNQFYKVDLIYLGDSGKMDIWLNGSFLAQIDFLSKLASYTKLSNFFLDSDYSGTSASGNTYYDNLYVETLANNAYPAIGYHRTSNITINSPLEVQNNAIYADPMSTASDVLGSITSSHTVKLFTSNYSSELTGSTAVSNGTMLVEYAQDGETMFYSRLILPMEIASITRETINEGAQYRYKARGNFANSGSGYADTYMLAIAAYDGIDNLFKVNCDYITLNSSYSDVSTEDWYVDLDTDALPQNLIVQAFIWRADDYRAMTLLKQY